MFRIQNVLHPKQNVEHELKWQTCFGTMQANLAVRQGMG